MSFEFETLNEDEAFYGVGRDGLFGGFFGGFGQIVSGVAGMFLFGGAAGLALAAVSHRLFNTEAQNSQHFVATFAVTPVLFNLYTNRYREQRPEGAEVDARQRRRQEVSMK